jgi:Calcineurin-like phosphoesterase
MALLVFTSTTCAFDEPTRKNDDTPRRPTSSSPEDFSFAVIGDFGSGSPEEHAVADRMCRYRAEHPFDLVVTTGDNVYYSGDESRFDEAFFDPFACLLNDGVTFSASLGNHDIVTLDGEPELGEEAFGIKDRNYVVRRAGVRFVIWDSNSADRLWLRRALRTRSGDRWTVAVFHHPVYSPGTEHGSTPGFRPALPRLFRKWDVDLVLNGHDHIYSVTKPLHHIRYVVTGGGGASLYGCRVTSFTDNCVIRHHFLYVRVTDRALYVRAVPDQGPPFDRFAARGRA